MMNIISMSCRDLPHFVTQKRIEISNITPKKLNPKGNRNKSGKVIYMIIEGMSHCK